MFDTGTHIRVKRCLKVGGMETGLHYWHHGIVSGHGEVIEFGGGDLLDKAATRVRRVTVEAFRDGCYAQVVNHPIRHSQITYSDPLPPEEVVDRALWLCANQAPPYRLGYRNCESIAIWCATGDFESFQAKRFMLWKTRLVTPVISYALRRKPKAAALIAGVSVLVTLSTAVPYVHSRRFFDHARAYPGLGEWERGDIRMN